MIMYKIKVAYDKKGMKIYCICRDGKLKYCSSSPDKAWRARQMFLNFYRKEGIAV